MYKDEGECSEASMCHNFMAIIGSQKVSFERGISRIMALPFFFCHCILSGQVHQMRSGGKKVKDIKPQHL